MVFLQRQTLNSYKYLSNDENTKERELIRTQSNLSSGAMLLPPLFITKQVKKMDNLLT
jgi:hypothetical protein